MSNMRSLIQLMTSDQKQREEELMVGLRDAEHEAVVQILGQDSTQIGLMHVLNNATGFAESMATKFRHPRTPAVDCKERCSWCCYQTVPVTAPEAFAIAEFILASEDQNKVEAKKAQLKEVIQRTRGLTSRERTKQHIPCAFLDKEICSIYQVRPLACSEFTSMDVNDCKRAYRVGFKPKGIIHEKARMVAFYAVMQGLSEGLRESLQASDTVPLELTGAVLAALRPNAVETWLVGERIFDQAHMSADPSDVRDSTASGPVIK